MAPKQIEHKQHQQKEKNNKSVNRRKIKINKKYQNNL